MLKTICGLKERKLNMHEYLFSWTMTRNMAKKLAKKQFYKYYFVQYFFKWFFFTESFFWILIFFNFNIYTIILSIIIGICVMGMVYMCYFKTMIPEPLYKAKYQACFEYDGFWVEGKNYKRQYTYNQIARLIVKSDCLIFLTKFEGMILPSEAFNTPEKKQEFVDWIKVRMS